MKHAVPCSVVTCSVLRSSPALVPARVPTPAGVGAVATILATRAISSAASKELEQEQSGGADSEPKQ
jgi:hypothetical protein